MNTEKILKANHKLKSTHTWLSDKEVLSLNKYCFDNCVLDNKNGSYEMINDYVDNFLTALVILEKKEVKELLKFEKVHRSSRSELAKIMRGELIKGEDYEK